MVISYSGILLWLVETKSQLLISRYLDSAEALVFFPNTSLRSRCTSLHGIYIWVFYPGCPKELENRLSHMVAYGIKIHFYVHDDARASK